MKRRIKQLTHCNPIDIRVVCFVIIAVKGLLSESEGGTDGLGKLDVLASCCQVFVDVVHGWNNGADVGCIT
jgi:hypothetical protein